MAIFDDISFVTIIDDSFIGRERTILSKTRMRATAKIATRTGMTTEITTSTINGR